MRRMMMAGAALWLVPGGALSQAQSADGARIEENAPVSEVEAVVVTVQSLERTLPLDLARYGADLAVATEKQIRDGGYVDVAQVVQSLTPGAYIAPAAGPFSYVDLSLQGSRTADVLWTVDGVRINNRLYNSTSPADTLPTSVIERVEVLKGGQGLFYGTQAAAGVINIVTRDFSQKTGGAATIGGDTDGGVHADGYVRGAIGPHRYVLFASHDQSDGVELYDVYQPSATDRERGYEVTTLGGKYGYRFSEALGFSLLYQHNDATLDNLSPRLTRRSYNHRDEEIVSARLDYTPVQGPQVFLKAYLHDWDTDYENVQNGAGGPVVAYPAGTYWGYRDYGLSALAKIAVGSALEAQIGYDYQNFSGRDDVLLIAEKTEQVHALIGQLRTTDGFSTRARFSIGVRHNETDGDGVTVGALSGRYDLSSTLYVEGVAGTSFVLPDAEQLFGIDPCCAAGNPDLKAERSRNLNASIGGRLDGRAPLDWKITGYRRTITDLISDDYADPAFPDGIYVNTDDEVKVTGFEGQVEASLGDDLRLSASYANTRARNEGSGLQRDRIPRQFAKAALVYDPAHRPWGAQVSANWVGETAQTVSGFGRQDYGDYVVADAAAHLWLDRDHHHRLSLRVQNLFDETYAARLGSALIDGSTSSRFLYRNLGQPRTASLRYSYGF